MKKKDLEERIKKLEEELAKLRKFPVIPETDPYPGYPDVFPGVPIRPISPEDWPDDIWPYDHPWGGKRRPYIKPKPYIVW